MEHLRDIEPREFMIRCSSVLSLFEKQNDHAKHVMLGSGKDAQLFIVF